jgi:hypothetical protein
MSAPPYDRKNGTTVDAWIQQSVPQYVQCTEPVGAGQVSNKQRCETIKNALLGAQGMKDVAAELEIAVTCGMYAGMMHATWMMEAGMHTTQLCDIYPDAMSDAHEYLKHFSEYSAMFHHMQSASISPPDLLSAVQGDSNFIHAVQAFLYGRGICGADGKTTCSPWYKIVSWMVDVDGELKDKWDNPHTFRTWSKRIAAVVEKASKVEYARNNVDMERSRAAGQWVVKAYNAKSSELENLKFMTGQGVPLDQNVRMLNFKYARSLFDALSEGPQR